MNQALLVNSNSDIEYLTKDISSNTTYISRNIIVEHYLSKNNISYYKYPIIEDKDNYNFVLWMSLNWFRDKNGSDLSSVEGISIGNIIARRILSAFANDYRNYFSIKNLLSNYDLLFASNSESESFKRVADSFGKRIKWYTSKGTEDVSLISSDPERTLFFDFPKVHPLSSIARSIQKPFINITNKRPIFNIPDWSSLDEWSIRNDILLLNSLLPWKGYYFNLNEKILREANHIFPEKIDTEIISSDYIQHIIEKKWNVKDKELMNHFCKLIHLEYNKGREIFKRTYTLYKEAFTYYSPESIIIPGETHFAYVIATHLANTLGIKATLAIDGYQFVVDKSIFYKRKNGKKFIFDKFLAYGSAYKTILISSGINEKDCIVCKSPLINKQKKINKNNFDVIIMCYNPNQHNPDITWDKRGEITLELIIFLRNNNYNRVALKIKDGSNDILYYRKLLKISGLDENIELLRGPAFMYVNSAKLVIGQFSTALFEFTYNRIPYYIYEPFENGKTDEMIDSSIIFNRQSISRNIKELEGNIHNNKPSVIADYDKIFDGTELSKINYSQLIN